VSVPRVAAHGEQTQRVAAAMVLSAAACFATMPTFAKLAYSSGADTIGVLLTRFALASVLVLGTLRLLRGPLRIGARSPAQMLLLIGLFSAQSFCFFASVEENTAVRAVLLLYTYPLITTLAAAALFGEPLGARKLALLGLGFAGVVLSVGTLSASFTTLGLALGVGSAVLFAAFMLAAKSSLLVHGAALEMMGIVYAGAAVVYVGIALIGGADTPGDPGGWWALGAVIGIGTLAAMGLFFVGLNHLPAGVVAMLSTLEPALSVLFAAAVLGETISLRQGLGILLVLGSLYALGRMISGRAEPTTPPIAP
jgi:drug/metabolite transporter (DMT)-like permease